MADWNPELYLSFEKQRTRPARDLALSVMDRKPGTIVDIGCGPGNSTAVLKEVFPSADIIGIDSSPEMIRKAEKSHPELSFSSCDARELTGSYDLIYSNACLQWLPEHEALLPFLMERVNAGGMLAVQMPRNSAEPLYTLIDEMVSDDKWKLSDISHPLSITLAPEEYHDILSGCASSFEIWETRYFHVLPSYKALIDWVRGTKLRPYLEALGEEMGSKFTAELLERAEEIYPPQADGSIVFGMRRLFFTAAR